MAKTKHIGRMDAQRIINTAIRKYHDVLASDDRHEAADHLIEGIAKALGIDLSDLTYDDNVTLPFDDIVDLFADVLHFRDTKQEAA